MFVSCQNFCSFNATGPWDTRIEARRGECVCWGWATREDFWGKKELADNEDLCWGQVDHTLQWLGQGQVRKLDFI